jgi:phytoene synthase
VSEGGQISVTAETRKGRSHARPPGGLSPLGELVRRHDRDRYQTALFAAADRREALFALYAFNYEVARVRESVTQPMLGQIRLQWWREVVDAAYGGRAPRRHEVAEPLTAAIREFGLSRAQFGRLIDAREADLADDPPADMAALVGYCNATSAELIRLAVQILNPDRQQLADNAPSPPSPASGGGGTERRLPIVPSPACGGGLGWGPVAEASAGVGIAYALAGLLRAMPFHARTGRCCIPVDVAAETGMDPRDYADLRATPALRTAVRRTAESAEAHLLLARKVGTGVPREALPALLPAVIAGRALARLRRAGWNPFDPLLAAPDTLQSWRLAAAAWRGWF